MGDEFRDPQKLITIGVTPPQMAPGTDACARRDRFWDGEARPSTEELLGLPWLNQRHAYQVGSYLRTHGLRKHARHLELELCNVPGAMIPGAMSLLNMLAEYVLNSGKELRDGQTLQLGGQYETVLAFREIAPGSDPLLPHEVPVLRVLFAC